MIVVSDTSPINNLAQIDQLHLLQKLYGAVFIPEAVYQELTSPEFWVAGASEVKTYNWIQLYSITNRTLVTALEEELDIGESYQIREINPDLGVRERDAPTTLTNRLRSASILLAMPINQTDLISEAITLAIELKAEQLLIDERRGRLIAERFNLQYTGILGILVEAKHKGLISEVKPLLDALINKAGFWVTLALYERVLREVDEE
ncbi:MAG: DUF3368 domain-containing protein [Chroococcales cyanobacterium]